jgi:hypothetical protein
VRWYNNYKGVAFCAGFDPDRWSPAQDFLNFSDPNAFSLKIMYL